MYSLYLDLVERVVLDQVYESIPPIPDMMPLRAYTGLSQKRIQNVRECCDRVALARIPGAFVECGVWRGGAAMMMAACNKYAIGTGLDKARSLFVCDSFEGLPRPTMPQDMGLDLWKYKELSVSEEEVRLNFGRLNLFEHGPEIHFVKGWFKDSLPKLETELRIRGEKIAILRADGDLYESTRNVMDNLYPLLVPGGFFIEDDYYNIPQVRMAVDEYRQENGISIPIERIDDSGCFWRIPKEGEYNGA